jgi:hypothetical protein
MADSSLHYAGSGYLLIIRITLFIHIAAARCGVQRSEAINQDSIDYLITERSVTGMRI